MLNKLKKGSMYVLIAVIGYLAIGYFLHLVVFPEKKPDVSSYFKPGRQFFCAAENVWQTVVKHDNGHVYCEAEIGPFAEGPPKHIHTDFDEVFEVANGELTVWVDGRIVKLRPGDKLSIPRGTPHKPYNETSDTIRFPKPVAFPEKFAYNLMQVYGVMDNDPAFGKSPKTLFQMALFNTEGFDSYLAEGPPVVLQKAVSFFATPMARLMGYKSFYEEYEGQGGLGVNQ